MEEKQIEQMFIDSEYCVNEYFKQHILPRLEFHQSCRDDRRLGTMATGFGVRNAFFPSEEYATDVTLSCPANDIEATMSDMNRDRAFAQDLEVLAAGWRTAAVAQVGEERYRQLCEEAGGDIASSYINYRLLMKMVDYEVAKNPIRGSADYIFSEARKSSLLDLLNPPTSELQKFIDKKCVEKYDPSLLERGAGKTLGAVTDLVLLAPIAPATGGAANWGRLGKFVAVDMGFSAIEDVCERNEYDDNVSQLVSLGLFGRRRDVFADFVRQSSAVSPYGNDYVEKANEQMTNKIIRRSSTNPFLFDRESLLPEIGARLTELPEIPDYVSQLRQAGELHFAMREKFGGHDAASAPEAEQQQGQAAVQQRDKSVSGWGSLLDTLGLSGFGDVGKNLGYVFAMLPDLLIGVFTGQTKRLNISDNLMPIAAIFGGMFVRNPILKMLLIGLGGANLLNKAGHEALDHAGIKSDVPRQYRTCQDEALDRRIKNPVMQGNTLVADIDGVPLVLTVSDEAVDAYYKGALPLNTLSNAVLRAWDSRQELAAQRYEQGVDEEQERATNIALK